MPYTASFAPETMTRAEIDATPGPLVLEFGANWCSWCQGAQAHIQAAFDNTHGVSHIKIEDGRGRPLGRSYGIKQWPTLVFLRDGQERARLVRPRGIEPVAQALAEIAPL